MSSSAAQRQRDGGPSAAPSATKRGDDSKKADEPAAEPGKPSDGEAGAGPEKMPGMMHGPGMMPGMMPGPGMHEEAGAGGSMMGKKPRGPKGAGAGAAGEKAPPHDGMMPPHEPGMMPHEPGMRPPPKAGEMAPPPPPMAAGHEAMQPPPPPGGPGPRADGGMP
ncbi:MAG TPA: hypothetical protein VFN67_17595 [Polyangiales bacterium]|nr:hypothetical protein [Polyangiales bacterium]